MVDRDILCSIYNKFIDHCLSTEKKQKKMTSRGGNGN